MELLNERSFAKVFFLNDDNSNSLSHSVSLSLYIYIRQAHNMKHESMLANKRQRDA